MNWNQPICGDCWVPYAVGHYGHFVEPCRVLDARREFCSFCCGDTGDGIYIRMHPGQVPYPKLLEDEEE